MKQKINHIYLLLLLSVMGFTAIGVSSCSFLDVVPDEIDTEEDAFSDYTAVRNYLYSCYSYLPKSRSGSSSLDLMTGDEVVTAFEHETFASFPKGNYSSSNTVISYWNTFFNGLRQCYLFMENVDGVVDEEFTEDVKADYKAQVKFLIAYYHYMLIRCYGPVIIIDGVQDVETPAEDYKARTPLDDCVDFVCNLLDEAAAGLPAVRSDSQEFGLATSLTAKAVKAKMLLYAASPLFNYGGGNPSQEMQQYYAALQNNDGTPLMPTAYDANKWEECKTAMKDAIDSAEAAGFSLYAVDDHTEDSNTSPEDPYQHRLRWNLMDYQSGGGGGGNCEVILPDSRSEGYYGIQNKSMPYCSGCAWNGIAPTWTMLNRFYTKNGLPWDEDPETKDLDPLEIVTVDSEHENEAAVGEQTILFNLDREPRFYAWVAFQGGYYEVTSASSLGAYADDETYDSEKRRLICDFVLGGNTSRGTTSSTRTNNYSPTGYLNKKGVSPDMSMTTSLQTPFFYPWSVIRLADLYLGYAEACVETNDLTTAKTYLNMVRERAGIPDVDTSWSGVATLSQDKLREIVRQERMIELYLENQNFWDMRRWLLAEDYFNVKAQGMNINASTLQEFATLTEVDFERKFTSPTNYLLPIPNSDLNTNENLVNNPGY